MKTPWSRSWQQIPKPLWWLLGGGLGVRLGVATWLPVGFDEVYYYIYSRHLSWSYFDHPPVVAITTGVGWWLTDTIAPLTIRVGALASFTLSLLLFYRVADHLFDRKTGILAVAIASLSPLLWLTFGVLTAPDNGLILFWTVTLWIAVLEFFPDRQTAGWAANLEPRPYRPSARIALLGAALGLACLSKYHGFILGMGLVGFCLTTQRVRRALWSPWTAVSLLVFGLVLMPLWIWNAQHAWISFRFHLLMRFDGGEPMPYRLLNVLGTWGLGLAYVFPTLGLPLWWTTGRAMGTYLQGWLRPASMAEDIESRDRTAFILWVSLPVALGFTLLGGKQNIYPAWPAPGFWGLTLLLARAATRWRLRTVKRWLAGTGLTVGVLSLVALLHLTLGILQTPGSYSLLGGAVPIEQDGSTALLDVAQLRSQVAATPELTPALADANFIFTDEFYLSSYVDMALHPLTPLPITCFSQDPRGFAFWHDSSQWIGQDALYVTLASLHADPARLVAEFQPYFAALAPLTSVPLTRGGVVSETVLIYQAMGLKQPYPYPYP